KKTRDRPTKRLNRRAGYRQHSSRASSVGERRAWNFGEGPRLRIDQEAVNSIGLQRIEVGPERIGSRAVWSESEHGKRAGRHAERSGCLIDGINDRSRALLNIKEFSAS